MRIDTIIQGNVFDVLPNIPDESVQCVITSPPYYSLRNYNVDGQIGLEKTPEEYIEKLVSVFREVRRILRKDGVLFLNIGDSYAGSCNGSNDYRDESSSISKNDSKYKGQKTGVPAGLKPKDLCMIPARLALALQADGWWVRSDIIWHKNNPMPESVTDRPTKSHEYIYLLAKGQWKTSVVKLANLGSERFHFIKNLGLSPSKSSLDFTPSRINDSAVVKLCVGLASSIFDFSQSQNNFSLPPFYSEIWQQLPDGGDSDFVRGLPEVHRSAICASRFLMSNITAKEFLSQINSISFALPNSNKFHIGGIPPELLNTPSLNCDSQGTVTIDDSGQICKFDFIHEHIIIQKPIECKYYYNADAIRESIAESTITRVELAKNRRADAEIKAPVAYKRCDSARVSVDKFEYGADHLVCEPNPNGRNARSVWTIPTQPVAESHFATFPEELVRRCMLAGTPDRCCPKCGAAWIAQIEHRRIKRNEFPIGDPRYRPNQYHGAYENINGKADAGYAENKIIGYSPSCDCPDNDGSGQSIVFDPFMGSGTTALVALRGHRHYLGVELNPDYIKIADKRLMSLKGQSVLL